MGQAGFFLETIIISVLTQQNSAIANIVAHNISKPQLWAPRPSERRPVFLNDAPTKLVSGNL